MNVCCVLGIGIKFLFAWYMFMFLRKHTCIELVLLSVIISWWWKDTCCFTHDRVGCLGEQPPKRLVAIEQWAPPVCQPVRFPLWVSVPVGSTQSSSGIRNPSPNNQAAPNPHLRPRGHRDRCSIELQLVWFCVTQIG